MSWAFVLISVVLGGQLAWWWRHPPGPGWRSLVRQFPDLRDEPHTILRGQSARIGLDFLERILVIELSENHMRLSLALPFGWVMRGAASIRLDDIILTQERQGQWWPVFPGVRMGLEAMPRARIRISERLAHKLVAASRGRIAMLQPDGEPLVLERNGSQVEGSENAQGRWAVVRSTPEGGELKIAVHGNRNMAEQHAQRLRDVGLRHEYWVEER